MNVAAVQFTPVRGPASGNLPRLLPLVEVAARGSDLVVCPEMATTGYLFRDEEDARRIVEPATGPSFDALAAIAKAHGTMIVCGFAEDAGDTRYNSAWVIGPAGNLVFVYRKMLLYPPDARWCAPGDKGYVRIDTGRGQLGVGICMDLNDNGFVRYLHEAEVDVAAFPTNWIDEGSDVHRYWQERVRPVRTVLVAANRAGEEDGTAFAAQSAIFDRDRVYAQATDRSDCVIRATVGPF